MFGIIPKYNGRIDFSMVRSFRSLASCGKVPRGSSAGHSDGWGIVAWERGLPVYLGREPVDAFSDPKFEEACQRGESGGFGSPLIAHLRKASVGVKTRDNTHPFVSGEWAFAHNGTIRRQNLRYTTDSQWFFELLMREYEKNGGDLIKSINTIVESVREVYRYSSLTFLASDGKNFYAYRDSSKNLDYYAIFYAEMPNSVVIAQEKFFDASWTELPNRCLLSVDGSLRHEVLGILPDIESSAA